MVLLLVVYHSHSPFLDECYFPHEKLHALTLTEVRFTLKSLFHLLNSRQFAQDGMVCYEDSGWVELVVEGTFEVGDFVAIEVDLVKWAKLEEPFP
jgi:hypothetical protein